MPQKRRLAINEIGHAHELTCSAYRRLPVFSDPVCADILLKTLGEASQRLNFDVLAYVVMPEHFHFLVAPRGEYAVSAILRDIKQPSAMKMLVHIKLTRPVLAEQLAVMKGGRRVGRLWQQGGGYDRNITKLETAQASINYIHQNPVARGLCELATDWAWSSAGAYALDPIPVPVPISTRWLTGGD